MSLLSINTRTKFLFGKYFSTIVEKNPILSFKVFILKFAKFILNFSLFVLKITLTYFALLYAFIYLLSSKGNFIFSSFSTSFNILFSNLRIYFHIALSQFSNNFLSIIISSYLKFHCLYLNISFINLITDPAPICLAA